MNNDNSIKMDWGLTWYEEEEMNREQITLKGEVELRIAIEDRLQRLAYLRAHADDAPDYGVDRATALIETATLLGIGEKDTWYGKYEHLLEQEKVKALTLIDIC